MRVDLAKEEVSMQNVGYCISSIDEEKTGEIESIFVDAAYKGMGIGDPFIKKALIWMEREGTVAKIVEVGAGNEQAFGFYEKYGFLPRKTVLRQV
jgi:ribosomal protein S18 acetylase RimI-like enzyme